MAVLNSELVEDLWRKKKEKENTLERLASRNSIFSASSIEISNLFINSILKTKLRNA